MEDPVVDAVLNNATVNISEELIKDNKLGCNVSTIASFHPLEYDNSRNMCESIFSSTIGQNTLQDKADDSPSKHEQNVELTQLSPELQNISKEKGMKADKHHITDEALTFVVSPSPVSGMKRKVEADTDFLVEGKKKLNSLTDEKKIANLRKNIRDVMGENQLDTNTLVAQREESERLARVAEQQKIIREYQRQTAVNKQNVRTQNRVISLLQSGNTFAKITDLTNESSLPIDCSSVGKEYDPGILVQNEREIIANNMMIEQDDPEVISSTRLKNDTIPTKIKLPTNDIVTIEDSSSEDDCILLSEEEEEDIGQEIEDDPSNSGLHVKDIYNVPDENGRVVVNIGHPEGEDDIFLAPQIACAIKPHQIGGVRFLFDNIIESTKRYNSSTGFGCILAHSMGLGKTLQVVCFCDIFLRHTESKTVLCVMPINTLQNWVSEFNMWIPLETDNSEQIRPRTFNVFVLNDQQKTLNARAKVILKWAEEGGVLLMGYELFRLLALKLIPNRKRRVGKNSIATEKVETEAHKRLSERICQALVKPGPDLVICDEGHRIKNSHAGISLALKQIRTRRRIVLTGYPLQNNLLEYWCMVDFVRPNYLGTRTEFSNMFERPIQNGQCIDSTPEDIKLMRYRAHVLHSLLVGFVQRRSHVVLQHTLPQKLEYVILTKMNDFQRKLYDTFMNDVVRKKAVPNPLKAFAVCCKIWNHPDVLYNFLKKRETDLDLEIDEADGTAESTALLKDNKTEIPTFSNNSIKRSEYENHSNIESEKNGSNVESNFSKNCEPSHVSCKESLTLPKEGSQSLSYVQGNFEKTISNKELSREFISRNYYQSSQSDTFLPDCSEDSFWNDSNQQYYNYQSLCGDVCPPLKPDYIGMVVKQSRELEKTNSSSQIVDLDTKEIKTVETDIDVTINQMVTKSNPCNITSELRPKDDLKLDEESCYKTSVDLQLTSNANSINGNSGTLLGMTGCSGKDSIKPKSEDVIPYDWAAEIMKGYEPYLIRNSPKMEIFFCILNESIKQGDRVLLFSQSLLTLNLIEKFLQSTPVPFSNKYWARNVSYFRLDGSTASQEREKLVNDFNANPNIILFLISTKAGSLGINLVGANRVIVFDASWNPCHDTQAVYRIYRYGQKKPCFVYRIVMDKCLEKKIYDRQVKKQGMSNRVVDECNPDAHLSMKDVTNLCYDYDTAQEQSYIEFKKPIESYNDIIIQKIIKKNKDALSKEPFHHESLLIDRKEKKLSLAEKRQAQRGYELEKKASSKNVFSCQANKLQYRIVRNDGTIVTRPVASVRPMQTIKTQNGLKSSGIRSTRWIPAEVWQRQGMTAQEMTLPLDVVIPTNSSDKSNIILKSGQRVMVLKSPKGIYMQLESGKIIAIRTSSKIAPPSKNQKDHVIDITSEKNKPAKQVSIAKHNFEFKTAENSLKNSSAIKENTINKATAGLDIDQDVIIINEEKIIKSTSINRQNQQNSQKQFKNLHTQKSFKFNIDSGAFKVSPINKNNSKVSAFGNSISTPMTNDNDSLEKKRALNRKQNVYTTKKMQEFNIEESKTSEIFERHQVPEAMKTFPEKVLSPDVEKIINFVTPAADFKDSSSCLTSEIENTNYTRTLTEVSDKIDTEYDAIAESQSLPEHRRLPQSNQLQCSHLIPISQHHHQEQMEPFVSAYNIPQHYIDKVQQAVSNHPIQGSVLTNLESTPHSEYYDPLYDNGILPSYEYSHRYPTYSSHSSYTSPPPHFHPHFHNFSNTHPNHISTHPYYMHWPPMTQANNQHNINASYPQNGSSANQWPNQR